MIEHGEPVLIDGTVDGLVSALATVIDGHIRVAIDAGRTPLVTAFEIVQALHFTQGKILDLVKVAPVPK